MNRWDHVLVTTILYIVCWVLFRYFIPTWPVSFSFLFLIIALVGGIFPDFDSDWKPLLGHRSFITHSILAPVLFIFLFSFPVVVLGWWVPIDRYIIAVFLLACGGHLLLDLAPSSKSVLNRWLKNPLEALEYIEKGRKAPPGNITYIPKNYEKGWLIGNGLALIAIGIMIWFILPLFGF